MIGKVINASCEACGKQRLVEHAADLDEQVRSIAGLEARDSLGGIADEALAVVPRQPSVPPGKSDGACIGAPTLLSGKVAA
jgi:hypothetical protein